LSVSLLSLGVGFRLNELRTVTYGAYCLFEYAFAFLLLQGCRNYATGEKLRIGHTLLFLPLVLVVIVLASLSQDFYLLFILHFGILATLFGLSYRSLKQSVSGPAWGPGLRVMRLALALLCLDFAHYLVVSSYVRMTHRGAPLDYIQYASIFDLILE